MMLTLLTLALGTLASEDLACIAAGVLVAQGRLSFLAGVLACLAGIFGGDLLLFLAGRLAGAAALRWAPLARFVPEARVRQAAEWLERRGLVVVFLSRFTPGLRLPTYFAAGLLRTRLPRFAAYLMLAAALWTPLLVGATALYGDAFLVRRGGGVLAVLSAWSSIVGGRFLLRKQNRRRVAGWWMRLTHWEFWPAWAAYLPLIPYLLWLAAKHRSLTLFTAANPGILTGGLFGESKAEILRPLGDAAAEFELLPAALSPRARLDEAECFQILRGLDYPVVLKPAIGERGRGVRIIRSRAEMVAYLEKAEGDVIIQRYVDGLEFGVFYYRHPGEERGHVFSITEKRFPTVTGDGRATVRDLVLRDPRAVAMVRAYERSCSLDAVPAQGERVPLVEIGSHCRGAIFLDGSAHITPELEAAIDRISRRHPGFAFGRFDLRVPSLDDLRAGRNLRVLELNGVGAEATHIYDPQVSLRAAYRTMARQWRLAFAIGAAQRHRGAQPMTSAALVHLWRRQPRTSEVE